MPLVKRLRCRLAVGRDRPQRCLVAIFLFVDADLDEDDLRSVGRYLRVSDPLEAEQVFLRDGPLGLRRKERDTQKQEQQENWQSTHSNSTSKRVERLL